MAKEQHTEEYGQGNGQNDAGRAGQSLHHLHGEVGGAHKLLEAGRQGGQIDDHHQTAAYQGQNQRVGHGAHHIPANVHAGFEQLLAGQLGIYRHQLIHGRADAHGHVVHRAQGGNEDTAHQQITDQQRGTRELTLLDLQQRLHLRIAGIHFKAVHTQQAAGDLAEDCGQQHAGERAQNGANGLFVHAVQNHKFYNRHIGAQTEDGGQGGPAVQQQGNQNGEDAKNGQAQAQEGFRADLPTHQNGDQQKECGHNAQHQAAVIVLQQHLVEFAVLIGQAHRYAVALPHHSAVEIAEVVGDGVALTLVRTAANFHGDRLLTDENILHILLVAEVIFVHGDDLSPHIIDAQKNVGLGNGLHFLRPGVGGQEEEGCRQQDKETQRPLCAPAPGWPQRLLFRRGDLRGRPQTADGQPQQGCAAQQDQTQHKAGDQGQPALYQRQNAQDQGGDDGCCAQGQGSQPEAFFLSHMQPPDTRLPQAQLRQGGMYPAPQGGRSAFHYKESPGLCQEVCRFLWLWAKSPNLRKPLQQAGFAVLCNKYKAT